MCSPILTLLRGDKMSQISLPIIAFIMFFSFTIPGVVIAQTDAEGFNVLQTPADFPDYVVVPRIDLNPFGMSTLNTSTLSARTEPKSNLVVNQTREKNQGEETLAADVTHGERNNITFHRLPLRTSNRFYTWVDENGVITVTNDPDSVPSGYRQ
jgi:hypothetical protein